jgi:hypothetical protein
MGTGQEQTTAPKTRRHETRRHETTRVEPGGDGHFTETAQAWRGFKARRCTAAHKLAIGRVLTRRRRKKRERETKKPNRRK